MRRRPTLFHFLSVEFEKAKIPFVFIGGFAVNYYGATRVTHDVDILIADSDFDKTLTLLQKFGYKKVEETHLFARFESTDPDFVDIDTVFVDPITMQGILREAKEGELEGDRFKFPSLNHLIALKLHALKHGPQRREFRDLGDILELVNKHKINVRSDEFKGLCLKFGTENIYDKILTQCK